MLILSNSSKVDFRNGLSKFPARSKPTSCLLAISFAVVARNEGPKCGTEQQEARVLVQYYAAFVKLFPCQHEKCFPPSIVEDATLARKNFNMKPRNKGAPYCYRRMGWKIVVAKIQDN